MKNLKFLFASMALLLSSAVFVSCDDDDAERVNVVSALVTVKTDSEGNSYFQVDKNTVAHPPM